jgi:hypothetical protein
MTTSNYSAIVDLHTLEITTAHVKTFQTIFTSRSLVTASNIGDFSASALSSLLTASNKSSLQRLPYNSLCPHQSQSYVTTEVQSASLSWYQAPI